MESGSRWSVSSQSGWSLGTVRICNRVTWVVYRDEDQGREGGYDFIDQTANASDPQNV